MECPVIINFSDKVWVNQNSGQGDVVQAGPGKLRVVHVKYPQKFANSIKGGSLVGRRDKDPTKRIIVDSPELDVHRDVSCV